MICTIRPARSDDYDAFVTLGAELGANDPPPTRERWDSRILARTWVAELEGVVVGYVLIQPLAHTTYVRNLVVARSARRQGIGRALMDHARESGLVAGHTTWRLNVRVENTVAIALYEQLGMTRAFRSIALRLEWADLDKLPSCSARTLVRAPTPGDDAALESRFALVVGILADYRKLVGQPMLALFEGTEPVGFARFDPHYPGAYPFCVARPELSRPLLDAIRPYALEGQGHVQLAIERDEATAQTLRDAGATAQMETFHMEGPL